ncbi:MAG TPA: hypothetical protein VK615_15510 [Candidatus Binatia bacterium]|nr:hypothetical protein [Candidatus Binatia bacterium]
MKSKTVKKSNLVERIAGRLAVGALALAGVLTAWAAPTTAPAPPAEEVVPPKSVFIDRPDFGKDPFFPASQRRGKVTTVSTNPVVVAEVSKDLILKGISTLKEKRLAIINNRTFEAGEEDSVRVNGLLVKVKVVELRDTSAVISVNGVTKELFLGQKF